jgi:hypothetical protein
MYDISHGRSATSRRAYFGLLENVRFLYAPGTP